MDLPHDIAAAILGGFDERYEAFRRSAVAAQDRFERSDWQGVRDANLERIDEYDRRVREAVESIGERFPAASVDDSLWPQIKRAYIELLYDHRQADWPAPRPGRILAGTDPRTPRTTTGQGQEPPNAPRDREPLKDLFERGACAAQRLAERRAGDVRPPGP
jgi:hypothetical protein